MTGYKSKKAAALDKLDDDDTQVYIDHGDALTAAYMSGYHDGKKAAQPAQEPVAWSVVGDGKFGEYELGQVFEFFVDYEATHIYWENRGYELVPVYTTPPQPALEQNFCPRCGKRTKDIHTCTPPQEKNNG